MRFQLERVKKEAKAGYHILYRTGNECSNNQRESRI